MKQFPATARRYVGFVLALGGLAGLHALLRDFSYYWQNPLALAFLLCLLAITIPAAFLTVQIFGNYDTVGAKDNSIFSFGNALIFVGLLFLNPLAAMLVSIIVSIIGTCHPKRSPNYQVLFSTAVLILSVEAASWMMQAGNYPTGGSLAPSETPHAAWLEFGRLLTFALLAATAFFLTNSGLVATIVALTSNQKPTDVWKTHFLWTFPSFFVAVSMAASAFGLVRISSHIGVVTSPTFWVPAVILTFLLIPFVVFFKSSHRTYVKSGLAREKHIEELTIVNQELDASRDQLRVLFKQVVQSLALAIDAKDHYTHEHILSVQEVSMAIAREMGVSGNDLEGIETASLLHDIGKLGVPEHILVKPGRLTEDEYARIKLHPELGAKILEPVVFPTDVIPGVLHHHERWDGKGYPYGLSGGDIPLSGRILAVADVFAALTSDRSYRKSWTREQAMSYIREGAGTHFDPAVVESFLVIMERDAEMGMDRQVQRVNLTPDLAIVTNGAWADATASGGQLSYAMNGTASTQDGSASAVPNEGRNDAAQIIGQTSQEYRWLLEMSQSMMQSLDFNETLTLISGKIRSQFKASTCVIVLRDMSSLADSPSSLRAANGSSRGDFKTGEFAGSRLLVHHVEGICKTLFADRMAVLGNGITGTVAQTGRGYVGIYTTADLVRLVDGNDSMGAGSAPDEPHAPIPAAPFASMLIVPLETETEIIGTVNLYQERADAFTSQDLLFLHQVARQAGRAIYNAMDYERTRESALTDSITGLPNARQLGLFLDEELYHAACERRELALLVIDLDDFKRINDTFGHLRGNKVLCDLGGILQETLRSRDHVARYAGDEFVIVLPGTGFSEAQTVCEKIRDAVRDYDARMEDGARQRWVGISIGAAIYPEDGLDAETLIAHADQTMYQDKLQRKGLLRNLEMTSGLLSAATRYDMPSSATERLQLVGSGGSGETARRH